VKTRKEVNELKDSWKRDPCWDIEETIFFEEYRNELLEFRLQCEAEYKLDRDTELKNKADKIGASGNTALASYVLYLESRIEKIQEKLESHLNND